MSDESDIEIVVNYLRACQETLSAHLYNGKLRTEKIGFYRTIVTDLLYTNRGIVHTSFDTELKTKEIWSWREFQEIRKSVFPMLPEHARCVDTLGENSGIPREIIAQWLFRLTHDITKKADLCSESYLRQQAAWLINDVRGGPITWNACLWLQGVILEDEAYDLGNAITIRRPRASDLENEVDARQMFGGNPVFGPNPFAIIEYQFLSDSGCNALPPFFADQRIESIIQILRLYKVGSVEAIQYQYVPHSYGLHQGSLKYDKGKMPHLDAYTYSVGRSDVEPLSRFIATLLDRIPSYMELLDPPKNPNVLGIPLPRYTDCLTREMSVEERIASAATCIEGLLLTDDDKGDIAYKFAQRLAKILRHFGYDPKSVAEDAHVAYTIRSRFVHGVFVKDRDRKATFLLCDRIVNYARIVMILCMQCDNKDKKTKQSFIKSIDFAMLDDDDAKQLGQRISGMFVPHPGMLPVHYLQLEEKRLGQEA